MNGGAVHLPRAVVDWIARSSGRAFLIVFLLAFGLRAAILPLIPRQYVEPSDRWEIEAIALSLVESGSYADPYAVPTGPTAHVPPIYPMLLAALWSLVGTSLAGGYARWLLDFAIVSTAFAILPWVAVRLGVAAQAGVLAGLAGALYVRWLSQTEWLAAIALGLLLVALVRRWSDRCASLLSSLLLGLGFGAAFHLKPELLTVLVGCLAFELWWMRRPGARGSAALLLLGVVLACAPWAWRNWTTFRSLIFVRSNFGLELRVGNHEGALYDVEESRVESLRHPRADVVEALRLRELGEVGYMRAARREALDWIRAHPLDYAWLTARRTAAFWLGSWFRPLPALWTALTTLLAALGARSLCRSLTVPQRAALAIPLATFPLVYCLVAFMPRYRLPVEWILLLLAGDRVWRWIAGDACGGAVTVPRPQSEPPFSA